MINQLFPGAKKGCRLSPVKKKGCLACPLYRSMPVDVTDPTTGKLIKSQTVWDCVFAWQALGAWDAGRQAQGIHAAVNQSQNETTRRQDQLLHLVATGAVTEQQMQEWGGRLGQSSDSDTRSRLPSAPPESLPSSQEPA